MLRWFLQIMVWVGDVAVIGIASWLVWLYPTQP